MKKERIEDLFKKNRDVYNDTSMRLDGFTNAINQAELEWYKKLEKKLESIIYKSDLNDYHNEIQDKIKELEKWEE